MKTQILLVRHGETEWTAEDRFNGRTDIRLSENGKIQAHNLGIALEHDDIAICFVTPLQRTQETARLAVGDRNIEIVSKPQLIEIDYGLWEGLSRSEIMEKYPREWVRWNADPAAIPPPRGESGYEVAGRCIPAVEQMVEEYANKTILVVAHNTINRILLAHALGIPISEHRRKLLQLPSGLSRIDVNENGEMRVVLLNDVSHFGDPRSPAAPRMSRTEVRVTSPTESRTQGAIDTGGGAYIGGGVQTGGGKFIGRDDYSKTGLSGEEIQQLFQGIYASVEQKQDISAEEKSDIKSELDEVKDELAKGEKADETFLQRRLRNIGRMAPDILEITLATITNPLAGFSMVARKVAEKLKQAQ